jgi:hypothetical protein
MATKTTRLKRKTPEPSTTERATKPESARGTKRSTARELVLAGPEAQPDVQPTPAQPSPGKVGKKPGKGRPVLVRDSFTMPEADFALLAKLKSTALEARRSAKKSELLRAGLQILAALDAESLVAALDRLDPVKTGRPKKRH